MDALASRDSLGAALVRMLALSLLAGVALGAVLSANGGSAGDFVQAAAISTLYAVAIAVPMTLGMHWLRRPARAWSSAKRWLAYPGVVAASSAIGTLVAGLVLVLVGVQPMSEMWRGYLRGLQIAFAIAVPAMTVAFGFAGLRRRLTASEQSLTVIEDERQRAVALATEARLASLESRIRPHFLFNALNSAIALIPEDPARAEQLLERLAGLLRFSLDAQSRTVTLREELAIVADYLEIERVRFGERLRYEIDVADDLGGLPIPAFAVQTLVENSVKYAVSPRKLGARIAVSARCDGDRLRLHISDDGPGFNGPVWIAGHGLDGLRARLEALYGDAAQLIVPAPATAGAAVTIELPVAR